MLLDFQNQRIDSAGRLAQSILKVNPKELSALQIRALTLAINGSLIESIEYFSRASKLDSKNPEILSNLGKAQHGAFLFSEAVHTYEKLNKLIPNNAQILTDLATSYARAKSYEQADKAYKKALQFQPDYFLAWSNYGNLLNDMGFNLEAIASYEKAIEFNPSYPETWTNYGNALYNLGRFDNARLAHEKALSLDPNYGEAWFNRGNVLSELKLADEAVDSYQRCLILKPDHPFLLGQLLSAELTSCIWEKFSERVNLITNQILSGKYACDAFTSLQIPSSPKIQKKCAEILISYLYPSTERLIIKPKERSSASKIRIGYVSSDFKTHPVGILMENLIRLHDRSKFEVYGFFLNKKTSDELEKRFISLFDKSFDLFTLSDLDARKVVLDQNLDIAIDLNGHTSGARMSLFARGLAPIQVSYLGFAGTTGASFYDYLIADEVVIPSNDQIHYSEKIVYMPNSFFPVDTSISIDKFGALPTRESQGLPANGVVFCCFNNSYKISPDIFSAWMSILNKTPDSVLWLSQLPTSAIENLKRTAAEHGVNPERLIFAKRMKSRSDHLGRLRLADLFLDTPNYNAHATAADALWAGVPVLTLIGNVFASRVAASQLIASNMSNLIVSTIAEYQEKAIELALLPAAIKDLKDQLEMNRLTAPLFNTTQYIKDLEGLYQSFIE